MLESLLDNDRLFLDYITYGFFIFSVFTVIVLPWIPAPYGRYSNSKWGWALNAQLSWFLQELPAVCMPTCLLLFTECPRVSFAVNKILTALFVCHYLQRTFVFPFLIRGGKPSTLITVFLAFLFCTFNSYQQTRYLLKYAVYPPDWIVSIRFIGGCLLFFIGMAINIHSDHILRNLRKPGEKDYKIPQGGFFEYVSSANFFGEILEWFGYALACWSLPAASFAFCSLFILGTRGYTHHQFYLKKFENYPPDRKAVIPFVF